MPSQRFIFFKELFILFLKNINLLVDQFILKYLLSHIYPTPPLGKDMTQGQFF